MMMLRFTNMMGKLSEGGRAVLSIGMVAASKAQKNLGRSSLLLLTICLQFIVYWQQCVYIWNSFLVHTWIPSFNYLWKILNYMPSPNIESHLHAKAKDPFCSKDLWKPPTRHLEVVFMLENCSMWLVQTSVEIESASLMILLPTWILIFCPRPASISTWLRGISSQWLKQHRKLLNSPYQIGALEGAQFAICCFMK